MTMPRPTFCDLVSQDDSHGMFLQSVNDSTMALVSFNTTYSHGSTNSFSTCYRVHSSFRGGSY